MRFSDSSEAWISLKRIKFELYKGRVLQERSDKVKMSPDLGELIMRRTQQDAGLIPRERSSGEKHCTGRLITDANLTLLTAIIESVSAAIRTDRGMETLLPESQRAKLLLCRDCGNRQKIILCNLIMCWKKEGLITLNSLCRTGIFQERSARFCGAWGQILFQRPFERALLIF